MLRVVRFLYETLSRRSLEGEHHVRSGRHAPLISRRPERQPGLHGGAKPRQQLDGEVRLFAWLQVDLRSHTDTLAADEGLGGRFRVPSTADVNILRSASVNRPYPHDANVLQENAGIRKRLACEREVLALFPRA